MQGSPAAPSPAPAPAPPSLLLLYARPRVLLMLVLGFASGLPWMLSGATLLAWLTNVGVRVADVAAFSLVSLPYSLKVLWAPLVDRFTPFAAGVGRRRGLGRRRGWMLIAQLGLVGALLALGACDPRMMPLGVGVLAVVVAALSATQDIAIDAYRTDLLHPEEAAAGTATYVLGYRLAMIVSGALALRLADVWGRDFGRIYMLMALLMLPMPLVSLLAPEPLHVPAPRTLRETVLAPLSEFFRRRGAVRVLLFIMLYRLGDSVLTSLVVPFLLRAGYSNTEVADATKLLGLGASILGALCGGPLVARLGLGRALLWFGLAQALTNLSYAGLAAQGALAHPARLVTLYAAVAIDNFCTGLVVAAAGAFLISQCDRRYSATQTALLTSASSLLGRLLSGGSGVLVERYGWSCFFMLTALLGLPSLLLLRRLRGSGLIEARGQAPR